MRRDGVQPGDAIWLMGAVGQAALGLAALQGGDDQPQLVAAHLWPQPLVQAGLRLRDAGVRAAIDVSDGLGLDAQRLAQASAVELDLDLPRPLWVTPEIERWLLARSLDWRKACASGGDDYALLCSAPAGLDLQHLGAQRIGAARAGSGRVHLRMGGITEAVQGFRHGD